MLDATAPRTDFVEICDPQGKTIGYLVSTPGLDTFYDLSWNIDHYRIVKEYHGAGYSFSSVFEYDRNWNILDVTFKNSTGYWHVRVFEYDTRGNLSRERYDDSNGFWSERVMKYDDATGLLLSERHENSTGYWTLAVNKYDSAGRLIAERYEDYTGSWNQHTREYDNAGRLLRERHENSDGYWDAIINKYDAAGRLISERHEDHTGSWNERVVGYDANGALVSERYNDSAGYWWDRFNEYDDRGRWIATTSHTSDGLTFQDQWLIDADGNVSNRIHTEMFSDAFGNWQIYSYEYDAAGAPVRTTHSHSSGFIYNEQWRTLHDNSGKVTERAVDYRSVDGSGERTDGTRTYDADGDLRQAAETMYHRDGSVEQAMTTYITDRYGNQVATTARSSTDGTSSVAMTVDGFELGKETIDLSALTTAPGDRLFGLNLSDGPSRLLDVKCEC